MRRPPCRHDTANTTRASPSSRAARRESEYVRHGTVSSFLSLPDADAEHARYLEHHPQPEPQTALPEAA